MSEDTKRRSQEENFYIEKVIATLYVVMFVLIVGMGVHTQLSRIIPATAFLATTDIARK